MAKSRREVVRVGDDLAIDFANTSLDSWSDLVDFLEVRSAVARTEGVLLRAMGEAEARRCAAALEQGLRLRETVRAILGALAAGRPLRARWVAEVNGALASGSGADQLVRHEAGWRLAFVPDLADPLRAFAPIARAAASLAAAGRAAEMEIRKCANPRCVRYFRDRSRSRRRRWCSMAVCGNRMKVAGHARRHGRRRSG